MLVMPPFEKVQKVFEENFLKRGDLGSACCVYWKGQKVIDLWGGWKDLKKTQAWEQETRVMVFSISKAVSAIAMALMVSRDYLDYDRPIAEYWPEFYQNGKEKITLRMLLEHRAGLYHLDQRITPIILKDRESLRRLLEKQKPNKMNMAAYHAQSIGWYLSAICEKVDPKNRTLSQFIAQELVHPKQLNFSIGLSETDSLSDIAELKSHSALDLLFSKTNITLHMILQLLNPFSVTSRALKNPFFARPSDMMKPPWPYLEIPASNGIGTPRSIAALYQTLLGNDGLLTREVLDKIQGEPTARYDQVLERKMSYHYGFTRPGESQKFGSGSHCMGFAGIGGAFSFADPKYDITYAYASNRLGPVLWNDPRERALREAVYDCL